MAKLQYTKPSFQVHLIPLTNNGGGCRYLNNSTEVNVCTIQQFDKIIFTTTNSACTLKDDGCQDIPYADGNIFNS